MVYHFYSLLDRLLIKIGINCTKPVNAIDLCKKIKFHLQRKKRKDIKILCYPNSGEIFDGAERIWRFQDGQEKLNTIDWQSIIESGADVIGIQEYLNANKIINCLQKVGVVELGRNIYNS